MADTSDGGKGDPPDPSNAHITTDAPSISTPAAYCAKNDTVSSKTDKDIKFFVHIEDSDDTTVPSTTNLPFPTTKRPPKSTTDRARTNDALLDTASVTKALNRYRRCQELSYAATNSNDNTWMNDDDNEAIDAVVNDDDNAASDPEEPWDRSAWSLSLIHI